MKRSLTAWKVEDVVTLVTSRIWKAWDKERFFDQNAWTRGSPPGTEIQPHRLE